MKLCIITHKVAKGDGQGRVNYEIVKEAIRRHHYVTILASSISPDLQENCQINWVPISVEGWPTELIRNMIFAWKSTKWLRKHRLEFNAILANGAITWVKADVNAVHFVHSSWLRSPVHISRLRRDLFGVYQWFYTRLNAHLEKKAFHQLKVVVAVSEKVKQELVDIGVSKESIQVILNGVDLVEFSPGSANRQELDLPETVTLALFVGDIRTARKNLDTVLHALIQVPELHLVVVGSTKGSPYPQLAASLGLTERAHFLGYRHDVSVIMQAVDLFVFPSRYEACTLVLLEAMASGLPVITATTTGGAELVQPECGVVLANSDDRQALAQVLKTLTDDGERRNQMGQAARSTAEEHSWFNMAQKYVDLFEELTRNEIHCSNTHLSSSINHQMLLGDMTKANSAG